MPHHADEPGADAPSPAEPPHHTIDVRDVSGSRSLNAAVPDRSGSASLEKPGDQIGPYKLISMLGEGGFGEVWLAERREPFVQQVALKVIKAGMDSKAVIGRFEQERQALAVMSHPGIARVLDGGLTPQGRPYFAMEHVKGEPITSFCDRVKLGIEERLRLFEQACEAIQHAHLKGIVHRDLKPGNVLAFMVEGEGPKLKVIDFGVAKAMSQRMTDRTIFTETGQMIGTPEYMSPEQADPTAGDIDTRSDIYSLGVMLYELLVGATPFDAVELRKKAYGEIQRTLREQDPPSPSARLSTLSMRDQQAMSRIEASRKLRATDLVRRLRGELEWIPQKAMRKEPQLRYQTAIALAEDVRNYLDGKPITAAPESTAYRVRKYVRRNRALVAGGGAVLAALLVGLGLATWQWRVAATSRQAAEQALELAESARNAATASEAKAQTERDAAEAARQATDAQRREAEAARRGTERLLGVFSAGQALDAARAGDVDVAERELARLTSLGLGQRLAARLASALGDQSIGELASPPRQFGINQLTQDGRSMLVYAKSRLGLWDLGRADWAGPPKSNPLVVGPKLTPEGRHVAVLMPLNGNVFGDNPVAPVGVFDILTGEKVGPAIRVGQLAGLRDYDLSPDGKTLADIQGPSIRLVDTATGNVRTSLGDESAVFQKVAFGPDGHHLASCGAETGEIRLWDLRAQTPTSRVLGRHGSDTRALAFSPDGRMLASLDAGRTIRLWSLQAQKPEGPTITAGEADVASMRFTPDAARLLTSHANGSIRVWDTSTGMPAAEPMHGRHTTRSSLSLAVRPDGESLAVTCDTQAGGSIEILSLSPHASPSEVFLAGARQAIYGPRGLCFSGDGRTLFLPGDERCQAWSSDACEPLGLPRILRNPDGSNIARQSENVTATPVQGGGTLLVVRDDTGSLRILDAATGKTCGSPLPNMRLPDMLGSTPEQWSLSPDARTLAVTGGGRLRLWDVSTGKPRCEPVEIPSADVLQFSPDGRVLASVDNTGGRGLIMLWDGETCEPIGEPLKGHDGPVRALAFSRDGKWLASGGGAKISAGFLLNQRARGVGTGGEVRLWDVSTAQPNSQSLRGIGGSVIDIAFAPDEATMVTCTSDGELRLWDLESLKPVGAALRVDPRIMQNNQPTGLAFSPDGRHMACRGAEGAVQVWHLQPTRERIAGIRELQARIEAVRPMLAQRIDAAGLSEEALQRVQDEVLADPRFKGDLQTAALIVLGRADLALQPKRLADDSERRTQLANLKRAVRSANWTKAIDLVRQLPESEWARVPATDWNAIAWGGLTAIPPNSPARDLKVLLRCADRAAEMTNRKDGSVLDTLARAHWELGDKPKAIEVQREAVAAVEANLSTMKDEKAAATTRTSLGEMKATLATYERDQPPAPPAASPTTGTAP